MYSETKYENNKVLNWEWGIGSVTLCYKLVIRGLYFRWGNWIFDLTTPSSRTMAFSSNYPLTEMSTSNHPGGKGLPARKVDCLENMRASTSHNVWAFFTSLTVSVYLEWREGISLHWYLNQIVTQLVSDFIVYYMCLKRLRFHWVHYEGYGASVWFSIFCFFSLWVYISKMKQVNKFVSLLIRTR
jgi:hypothetical protein